MIEISLPGDVTPEEIQIFDVLEQRMLQRLDDRRKFLFVYIFQLGRSQRDAAMVLGVNETNISRHMRRIREILSPLDTRKEKEIQNVE